MKIFPGQRKTVHLHIGLPKTGTTALQYFLDKNRDALQREGFLFPKIAWHHHSQHKLAFGLRGMPYKGQDLNWESLEKELKKALSTAKCPHVVLSSEELAAAKPEQIATLQQALKGVQVKVYLYLRRQDEFLESLYNQQVKTWWSPRKERIERLLDQPEKVFGLLDYNEIVDRWAERFGEANVGMRVYARDMLVEESIIDDFLNWLGLDREGFESVTDLSNSSVSGKCVEVVRMSKHLGISDEQRKQLYKKASTFFEPQPKETLLTCEERRSLLERYEGPNQQLGKRMGYAGSPFLPLDCSRYGPLARDVGKLELMQLLMG